MDAVEGDGLMRAGLVILFPAKMTKNRPKIIGVRPCFKAISGLTPVLSDHAAPHNVKTFERKKAVDPLQDQRLFEFWLRGQDLNL